jgi:predicted regulator of Ras-like GTPase activity (Roadblock/LC7/MglB family)
MKEIVHKLDGVPGVHSALLMTVDGVIVASVPEGLEQARVAAFVSAVMVSIEKGAETLGLQPLQRVTLTTARGRLLLMPVGELALVVIADQKTDLNPALTEVTGLTRRVLRQSRMDVPA